MQIYVLSLYHCIIINIRMATEEVIYTLTNVAMYFHYAMKERDNFLKCFQ
jgi:hypothetical protein